MYNIVVHGCACMHVCTCVGDYQETATMPLLCAVRAFEWYGSDGGTSQQCLTSYEQGPLAVVFVVTPSSL